MRRYVGVENAIILRSVDGRSVSSSLPQRLDRYVVEALVGRGGMGSVYRAYDPRLRRTVALKVIHGERTPAQAATLLREARAAAALRHPNIVTIYDVAEVDGTA